MSPIKKKNKVQVQPASEASRSPKGAYEDDGGLYGGGSQHRSLNDEVHAAYRNVLNERDDKLHGVRKSKHVRQDVEERQVIPLLFLFKWAVIGAVGVALLLVLKSVLGGYNRNAADTMAALRDRIADLEQIQVEGPLLDLEDADQVSALVQRWQTASDDLSAAEGLMRWDRRDEAQRRLRDVVLLVPEYQAARVQIAQIAMKNKEYERAANMLIHTLNVDPARHDLALMLARSLEKLGKNKAAFFAAEWVLSNSSNDLDALGISARASVRLEDWESALNRFDKMLIVDENNLEALIASSSIYYRDEVYAKAVPLVSRLLDREPEVWQHFFQAAVCQAQLGRMDSTVMTLELASSNFGDHTVFGWLGQSQFDGVREGDLFRSFEQRVAQISEKRVQKKVEAEKKMTVAPVVSNVPSTELLKESGH